MLSLSDADLEQIDRIMADAVPIGGPSPEAMPSADRDVKHNPFDEGEN